MYEALERFKKLLRKCPQHNLTLAQQVERFYDGLSASARANLDAAANGEFDALPAQGGWDLIKGKTCNPSLNFESFLVFVPRRTNFGFTPLNLWKIVGFRPHLS